MKRIIALLLTLSLTTSFIFAKEKKEDTDEPKVEKIHHEVTIPQSKKPLPPDKEKAEKAALKDEGKDAVKDKKETLAYGIETEILSLIKDLISNEDPRFSVHTNHLRILDLHC